MQSTSQLSGVNRRAEAVPQANDLRQKGAKYKPALRGKPARGGGTTRQRTASKRCKEVSGVNRRAEVMPQANDLRRKEAKSALVNMIL